MDKTTSSKFKRTWKPSGAWITARKIVQYLALVAFLSAFILSRRGGAPGDIVNFPMRLDPLLTLSHLISSRIFLAASALSLLTVLLTLIFGRAWCGWLCPLGTILDLIPLDRWRKGSAKPPAEGWRGVKYFLLLTILAAALLGNLTLLVLDPLTILFRTLTVSIWPALNQVVTAMETGLYRLPILAGPVAAFDVWMRPRLLPTEPIYYRTAVFTAVFFASIVALSSIAPRFWCRYLCPLGGLLGSLSKIALFRREVGEDCPGCTLCTQVCPTGTIDPELNYVSDAGECTMCMDCLEACPRSGIAFRARIQATGWRTYDPNRRKALAALGTAIAGTALFNSLPSRTRRPSHLLRPPGARNEELLSICVRCAECVRACPTAALQPSIMESGLEGLWTPVFIPRLGYCDYSCTACGAVCPVEAIPKLSLDEKRLQVIGVAEIDKDRCIAWGDHQDCIVCEEMCPVPEKAIFLKESSFESLDGRMRLVQLPYVEEQRCIGCGICENKCPVEGDAAIRVFVTGESLIPF